MSGLLIDECDSLQTHGQNEVVGVGPEALVLDIEEGAAVERVVLDCREVPHLRLDLRLPRAIGLCGEKTEEKVGGGVVLSTIEQVHTCVYV